jgi:hypothetical protein
MPGSSFWSSANVEPKRQYRWTLTIGSTKGNLPSWIVKSVDKPVATVSSVQHKYLGYTYNYPGTVSWNDINIVLVDPVAPNAVGELTKILRAAGYNPPLASTQAVENISKQKSTGALGEIHIHQVDAEGVAIEEWTLTNAIITSADFGGALSYDNENLIEVKLGLKYDWAAFLNGKNASPMWSTGQATMATYKA